MKKTFLSFLSDHYQELITYSEPYLTPLFTAKQKEKCVRWMVDTLFLILENHEKFNCPLTDMGLTPKEGILFLDKMALALRNFVFEKSKNREVINPWNTLIDQIFIKIRQQYLSSIFPEESPVFYSDFDFVKTINDVTQKMLQESTENGVLRIVSDGLNKFGLHIAVFKVEAKQHKAQLYFSSYSTEIKDYFTGITGRDPQGPYFFNIPPESRLAKAIENKETLAFFPNDDLVTCLINNKHPELVEALKIKIGSRKTILACSVVNDELKAVLAVSGDALTEKEIPIISIFANQVAIAMQNASLYQAADLRSEQLAALSALAKMAASERSIMDILNQANPILEKLISFDCFSIIIKQEDRFHFYTIASTIKHEIFSLSDSKKNNVFNQILQNQTSVMVNLLDEYNKNVINQLSEAGIQSLIICPMVSGKETWGTINLGRKSENSFTTTDQQLMDMIADQLSPLIENVILYRRVEESEARFRTIYEQAMVGISVYDWRKKIWNPNPAFVSMLGCDPKTILRTETQSIQVIQHPEDAEEHKRKFQDLISGKINVLEEESRYLKQNGQYIWAKVFMSIVHDAETTKPIYTIVIFEDITERKLSEAASTEREQKYRALFELSADAIFILDKSGVVRNVNPAAEKMLGYPMEQMINRTFLSFFPDEDEEEFRLLGSQLMFLDIEDLHARFKTASGNLLEIEMNTRRMDFEDHALQVIVRDITEKKKIEQELKFLGTHDLLTGLYNRNYFEIEMQRYQHSRMYPISMIIIDVDGLKQTNDQQGHQAGDLLLKQTAAVLKSVFRAEDIVARWGGDEFSVLLPLVNRDNGLLIKNRIIHELRLFNETLPPGKQKLSFSIGVETAQEGDDLRKVIKSADEVMYEEKIQKRKLLNSGEIIH